MESLIKIDGENHKAFLTQEGTRLMKERLPDIETISFIKKNNDELFIFASENSNKPLEREAFTRLVNSFIRDSMAKYKGN